MSSIKQTIKNIPLIGQLLRWSYNFVHLNRTKHTLFMLEQKHIKELKTLKNELQMLKEQLANTSQQSFWNDYYLAFEERFRGSRDTIRERMQEYCHLLPCHSGQKTLDLGTGRAEWVELLQSKGIDAWGVDLNVKMLEQARKKGIKNLVEADALSYLHSQESNSFDIVSAFHLIEHISFTDLVIFLREILRVLKPGGIILLETPNPANIMVGAHEFYVDPTHKNPLPSQSVSFLLEYIGFKTPVVHNLHPFEEFMKLKEESESAQKINQLFYGPRDYLLIAKKGV